MGSNRAAQHLLYFYQKIYKKARICVLWRKKATSIISHRACHLIEVTDEQLDHIVEELKTFLTEAEIPETYKVNIYKDQVNCCGHFPIGVAVEIQGPEVQSMKNVDETILCKIIEICGRENIKYHECSPLEIVQNLNG